uniref:Rubrerythrin heme iron peroxidase n=1 Tax=Caudovirales sp. ctrNG92 TaxID=2827638 RepID=A0A8S5SF12_9CAUD|nr:MAG TPA: Rubrerythrin heme iron peroxidase [Caudovirales sp. ctrNG92]
MTEQEYNRNIKRIERAIKRDQMIYGLGMCPHCKGRPVEPGRTRCAVCAEKENARSKKKRIRQKEARIAGMPESEARDMAVALIGLAKAIEEYRKLPYEREVTVGQLRRAADMLIQAEKRKEAAQCTKA